MICAAAAGIMLCIFMINRSFTNNRFNAEILRMENKLTLQKAEYEKKIKEINAEYEKEIKAQMAMNVKNINIIRDMKAAHRNEIDLLNAEHKNDNDRSTVKLVNSVVALNTKHKNEIDELNAKYKLLEENYNKVCVSLKKFESNLTAFPYMAGLIADIETYGLEKLALGLDWGHAQKRLEKVKSIRDIRKDAKAMIEKNKDAQYQLAYLLQIFPNLADIIECDFRELPTVHVDELSEYDSVRDYLTKEEYAMLSTTEKNQLALDRYMNSHKKTKLQIGRDYEQFIAYKYRQNGFAVDDFGTRMGLEDLGRDVIAKKDGETVIVQCKYWSTVKQIHENHITQLYGTKVCYALEHDLDMESVVGTLVTNITLSDMAKAVAKRLGIRYFENQEMGTYPCIKCNLGHGEYGQTKIYHLPFDQQYDVTKIEKPGEFYAMTVAEAEAAGFRRTYKWFGNH